ncbi:MAG: carbohydrate binding domain-containing protein [Phycisphaerales bacterium]|nr:MAG: carbohydrate binding domain-containing protein [Phycisphaerales bacterium]
MKGGNEPKYQKAACVLNGLLAGRILVLLTVLSSCVTAPADDFVPFVIPAEPNPESPLTAPSGKAIEKGSQRLTVRDAHFYRGDRRVRLWGVNLSFGANLPTHADAPRVAARLAAAGVNAVRCHHLDTARWPRGLWNARDGKTIEPEALDRLDYFIDQLARRGIWVNINLHVGRAHSEYIGLPKTNRNYDKISGIFTPALVDAQKRFARDILNHVNTYRKVRYADDPAVAILEITNEDSFFMWGADQTLRTLPEFYANILRRRFNQWLANRYGSDEKLRRAWAKGASSLGDNLLKNGDFRVAGAGPAPKAWYMEQHGQCKASASRRRHNSKDGLRIDVAAIDDTSWHLQFGQSSLALKAGQYYTVSFQAAAASPRTITCGVSQAHEPWSNLGLSRETQLKEGWQTFTYGFTAKADDGNARISFTFGGSRTPFYLADVELRPGGRVGLQEDESVPKGSVALFIDNEGPERTLDRMRFLAETEKSYFDGIRSFIRNELGCKALVTGTIVFGPLGLYAQSDMDFIDTHAYWQHPRFPGRPWDAGNWLIDQKPMTDFPEQATLFRLAACRPSGKPFTLSEYNHPAPLDSQAECVPMAASFAAAQDWDGVWFYTYSHSGDTWDRRQMSSYFDIDTNPAKWGFMRAGAALFRLGGIAPLRGRLIALESRDLLTSLAAIHLEHGTDMFAAISSLGDFTRQDMLGRQIVLSLKDSALSAGEPSDTRLSWSVESGRGVYAAFARSGWVLVGNAARFGAVTRDYVKVESPGFATITITALDEKALARSRLVLVTACGRCENTGMKFSDDRRTVGRNWGGPPVQIEAVKATLRLKSGKWNCQALGPDGTPRTTVPVSYRDGTSDFQIAPKYSTMWYLLTRSDLPQ